MKITNQVDAEWFIDYAKSQKFIEESGIRAESIRQFHKEKGNFIFAHKTENLGELCPYFVLNYTSAETLNSLAGVKIYPSLSGFLIELKNNVSFEDLLNHFEKIPQHECDKHDVAITEYEKVNDDEIKAKIIYTYERSTKLFFPNSPVTVKVTLRRTDEKFKILVFGEIFRWMDFSKIRNFFALDFFRDKFTIIDVNFQNLNTSQNKHVIIKKQIEELKKVKLTVEDIEGEFELLGTYEHRASEVDDLNPSEEISYFATSKKLNTETNVREVDTLIQDLETQAGKCLTFIKCIYYSKKLKKYISISYYYERNFMVTFQAVYLCDEPKEDTEIKHPETKQDLHNNHRKILEKKEISEILSVLWIKSVSKILEDF